MSFIYTRADLKSAINSRIQNKIGMLADDEETVNSAVREVITDYDLRSLRRSTALAPNLFSDVFEYAAPSDLMAYKLIDIPAQAKRQDGDFFFVPSVEFDIKHEFGSVALDDANGIRTLKIASRVNSHTITLSELDSITSSGSWVLFGDGTNVATDTDDFVHGSGSVSFDLSAAGGTTAGIQTTSLTSFDITDYLGGNGAIFVYAKINSTTNLTNYILRIGSSSSNYYQKTATTRHDGTAFVAGWNLIRFDLTSLTTVGTPTNTAMTFAAIYMTKTAGKISETDYKFDFLVMGRGVNHYVDYYSKYGWQTSAGAYLENSTDDSDVLVADTDEFKLFVEKGVEQAQREIDDGNVADKTQSNYEKLGKKYQTRNPSEAKIMTNQYYSYGNEQQQLIN